MASGVVSQVGINGVNPLEISIEVSEQDLARYGITFDQVANAVRLNNRDISAGSIKASTEEILIRSRAKETDAALIADIVVRSNKEGSDLLLKDIATITEQYADQPNKALLNGKQAVFIEVRKLENEDLQEISVVVNDYVEEFNSTHSGIKLEMTWDFMSMLNQRLDLLTNNGMIGLLLVLLALGTFLNLRLSFWVAWGIPSSFLGMFILGSFFGLTINMISLFGMILVIGILVDDGIVIAENIYSHFERHKNPVKAAVQGTLEVVPAVFTSVTTTIVAFTPLFLLTGGMEFLKDMALVVVFSLAFSLLEAFFVLPAHLASKTVLNVKKEDTRSYRVRAAINKGIDFMRYNVYGSALKLSLKYRFISLSVIIGLFAIVAGLLGGGFIKSTFFPQIPFNSFNINIAFKPGEREARVEQYLERFENAVWAANDELKEELDTDNDIVNYTFGSVGNNALGDVGSHAGNINVFYKELDEFGINSFDLIGKIKKHIGEVPEAEKFTVGGANRWGKPISIRLLGKNFEQLQEAKDYLKAELLNITELKEIQDNVAIGKREMLFDLNPQAYFLGLSHNEITKQIRQGFFGEEVQRLQKGDDEVRVWVRYPKSGRLNVGQLEDTKIKTSDGQQLPLTQLTGYSVERGISGIRHFDGKRAVTVEADMIDPFGEVPPIIKQVQETILPGLKSKFPTVTVDMGGQAEESAKAGQEIGLYFGGALMIMLFIIMITFRSLYQAVLIFLMIPIGWMGAAIGHGIESWINPISDFPVSLLSAWGMVALSGVVINDAVVFLSKYNSLLKEGKTVQNAAFDAGIARFRPIMLTSITTVVGLYPLIKETSFQAQFLIPMAISVAYGVLIGTFIILLFFPPLIMISNDIRIYLRWVWTGQRPVKERVERVVIDEERVHKYDEAA